MRALLSAWLGLLLTAGLLFTTGACGSGSGTTGTTPGPTVAALSASPYCWLLWTGDVTGPDAETHWGTVTPDGVDTININSVMENADGVVGAGFGGTFGYLILGASELYLFPPTATLSGGLALDGSVGAVTMTSSFDPALVVLGRKGSGFSNASLQGDYHVCAFFRNGGANSEITWWGGTATFDGAGNCTGFSTGVNNNGAILAPAAPVPLGTYSVMGDGTLAWAPGIGGPWEGGLFADGELAVLTGSTMNAVNFQFIVFLIRKGAGLGNASFSGAYHLAALLTENAPPPRYQTVGAAGSADGAGTWTYDGIITANQDSMIRQFPGIGATLSYTVAGDGAFSLVGGELQGGISQSGRFVFAAGSTSAGTSPFLFFWLR